MEKGRAHKLGTFVGLAEASLADGATSRIHILEWQSASIKRVVRSTLPAEGYGLTEGAEALDWIRNVIADMTFPSMKLTQLQDAARIPALWLSDSKSLVDVVLKDCGQPSDKRLRIVVANLKQMLQEHGTSLQWIDTLVMLADPFTKLDCDCELLRRAMSVGSYCVAATQESLDNKERSKLAMQRAKEAELKLP